MVWCGVRNGFDPVGQLGGIGASAGVVRGRARVVTDWQPTPAVEPGDILVAENTGPQWMPFMPVLGGIVLESGSLGQHAASTAREYGLPAVIAARGVRHRIQDGGWITIDGVQGLVTLKNNITETNPHHPP
jgi:pyruvate,water dikinase